MSNIERIAWPFSFTRTIPIAAFDIAVLATAGLIIAYGWPPAQPIR
jgi:hypothetical protein